MDSNFDYIIIGGGTAGVVIASRLKQYLPSSRIALLEAGPNAVDHPKVNDVSEAIAYVSMVPEGLVVDYSTSPQEHLDGREIPNPAGRFLSGSSGINVATWMRPSISDCGLIAERAGDAKFKFQNMVKYFRRLETHFDKAADKEYYGFDGPIHTGRKAIPTSRNTTRECREAGTSCYKATSESTATRQHSARVYDLSKVEVFCDTPVARILFDESKRANGVELLSGKKLYASKEVIISCGTQKTPQILMLSGIGPSSELAKHSIPTLINAPAIGQNLFDHSVIMQQYKLKDASKGYARPFTGTNRPEYTQGIPTDFSLVANIPPTELTPHLDADGLNTTASHPLLLDKRCHHMNMTFYLPLFALPALFPTVSEDNTHVVFVALHMLPLSRGTVTLKSTDPKDNPICNPRFLSTHTDRFIMRHAVRESLRLASTSPLADEIETEVAPMGFPVLTTESTDDAIDARIRSFTMTISHPMGTCALGTVLDNEFRVKETTGLRVCDASVFPEPIAAMPSCMVYALGEMCAEMVAGKM